MTSTLIKSIISIPHRMRMIFYKNKKEWISKGKYNLSYIIPPRSALEYHITKFGILNDWITSNLSQLIPQDGIVFDVGANVGLVTLPIAKAHIPQGKLYAFEPEDGSRRLLEKNIKINRLRNIKVFPYALQDNRFKKIMKLSVRETIDGDGLINKGLSTLENIEIYKVGSIKVRVTTVDKIVNRLKIKRLDFLKLDVEGSEYKVIRGAEKTIINFKPIIQYEYSSVIDDLAKSKNSIQCFMYLKKLGYTQYEIVNEKEFSLLRKPKILQGSNILCFPAGKDFS